MLTDLTVEQAAALPVFRDEWLTHGLSCEPADRVTTEAAIVEMYRLIGEDRPRFVWCDSPATGLLGVGVLREGRDSLWGSLRGSLGDSLWDSLWDSLGDSLRGSLWDSLGDSLRGSLWDSLQGSLRGSLRDSLGDSLGDSLWDSLWDSLRGSLWDSLGDSLWGSLWGSLGGSLWDSLGGSLQGSLGASLQGSLRGSLRGSLGDSLGDSLGGSLWDSLRGSLWGSLGGSLQGSLGASLQGSLRGSLRDSLGASLGDSLRGSLRDSLGASLGDSLFWGQHDAYWIAYYLFPETHLGVRYDPARSAQLGLWADIARSSGWWWPYRGLVVCTDRPAEVHMEPAGLDGRCQLHCSDGPAVRYRDGWAVHAWHGTRVPADLIETDWSVEQIAAEANTEVRRCAIEKHGWDAYLSDLGVTPVDECDDPGNPGHRLVLYDLPDAAQVYAARVRLVVMRNASRDRDGSRRTFAETVPVDVGSALAAQAWAFDVDPEMYARVARAT